MNTGTTDAWLEAVLTSVMSSDPAIVEPSLLLTRIVMEHGEGGSVLFKVLNGEVGDKFPEIYPLIMRQYLKVPKPYTLHPKP